jgi:small subunit ribosomal protein S6e
MEVKLVINNTNGGKSYSKVLTQGELENFTGKRLGEELDLSFIGLDGYSGRITGGSYMTGTPMRKDIDGIGLKKILSKWGVGNKTGVRRRKSVAGNTISQFTSQINVAITKQGSKNLEEAFPKKKDG